jgi:diadenosine tetraphosphate (Ap4A) HIT family hydrolase
MNSPFQLLCDYLKEQMRMSHIYQPVMIKRLLIEGRKAKDEGESAGQTVSHCHIHLMPRRKNDVENPRGGIRHTIPGKGFY